MSTFEQFAQQIKNNFDLMANQPLFRTNTNNDLIKEAYLNAFPEGTNELYITNTTHDCSCCKAFIRNVGNLVSITDGEITTIWDNCDDAPYPYNVVAAAMAEYIRTIPIGSVFLASEKKYGAYQSKQTLEDGSIINWNHFNCEMPNNQYGGDRTGELCGQYTTSASMLTEAIQKFSPDAVSDILDLINDNAIYRGEEHRDSITRFKQLMGKYLVYKGTPKLFGLEYHRHPAARFKNTVIGTLVADISSGIDIENAVKAFEAKVAPANYKRSKSLITQGMINQAMDKINELEIEPALSRRHATIQDMNINDVLYADHSVQSSMKGGVAALLQSAVNTQKPNTDKAIDISIEDFLTHQLPNATSIEALVENKHQANFMNIIAPANDSPSILKWDNNFTWSYNGNVTDSMKETVKAFGGAVDGAFRFSIMWNEDNDNPDDLDAHCQSPYGHVYYSSRKQVHLELDVDITSPHGVAVENIVHAHQPVNPGEYKFYVKNYSARGATSGFKAEFEIEGKIYEYSYPKPLFNDEIVQVVTIHVDSTGRIGINHKLPHGQTDKEIYGVKTNNFVKVNNIMLSPNHWGDNQSGNKHFMFLLDGANNPEQARGFYNEFLSNDLNPHRKVFEVLASKMKVEPTTDQLCGLGFSSTVRNELIVKVTSTSSTKLYNIKF